MKSFIYLIYSEIGYMIGKSSDIHRRFAVIDAHSPVELQLFRVYRIPRNGYHEKKLHKKYLSSQIRCGWFDLNFEDVGDIDSYLIDNDGIRILDNLKKIQKSPLGMQHKAATDTTRKPLQDDLKKLEHSVEQLKRSLDGRKTL